jgi:hypothetical protein
MGSSSSRPTASPGRALPVRDRERENEEWDSLVMTMLPREAYAVTESNLPAFDLDRSTAPILVDMFNLHSPAVAALFLGSADMTNDDWQPLCAAIATNKALQRMELMGDCSSIRTTFVPPIDLFHAIACSRPTELDLEYLSGVSSEVLQVVLLDSSVKTLSLCNLECTSSEALRVLFLNSSSLKTLTLLEVECAFTEDSADLLENAVASNKTIESLTMHDLNLDIVRSILTGLIRNDHDHLERLILAQDFSVSDELADLIQNLLESSSSLQVFSFCCCPDQDAAPVLRAISLGVMASQSVKDLSLWGLETPDQAVTDLCQEMFLSLHELTVGCDVSFAIPLGTMLARVLTHGSLKSLEITDGRELIKGSDLQALSAFLAALDDRNSALENLCIDNFGYYFLEPVMIDRVVELICSLPRVRSLKKLKLVDMSVVHEIEQHAKETFILGFKRNFFLEEILVDWDFLEKKRT